MTDQVPGQLDAAHGALRAWCHDRPDLRDPPSVYAAFGTVTAIIATLEHIVDVASRSAASATGTDDDRTAADTCDEVRRCSRAAIVSLEEAHRAVAGAHTLTGHLIFAIVDDVLGAQAGRPGIA